MMAELGSYCPHMSLNAYYSYLKKIQLTIEMTYWFV